ncbi:MAG: hypothetical protein AB7F41_07335 [Methylocystis sp.]|uniref:hypothetical protein n=1 Tax=Methylocystis sp. TaxID=1911079 RepID=UPI003D0A3416
MRAAFLTTVIAILLGAFGASAAARSGAASSPSSEARDALAAAQSAWRQKVEGAKQRYEAFAARAGSELRMRRSTELGAPSSLEPFSAVLDDPTLRYNDLVVTHDGVFMFRGVEGSRHSAAEFERLPDARVRALSLRLFDETN